MKTRLLFLIALVFVVFECKSQTDQSIQKIEQYLHELAKDKDFSLGISISKAGTVLLEKAFGYASREHSVLNKLDTKFNIASIGKLFTAVSILQLKEQNKIGLDQTIGTYLPEFPHAGIRDSVTIHQLLTHTSGLPLWFSESFDRTDKFDYLNLADYRSLYEDLTIDRAKVGKNNYSNVGYILLGFLIEEISGRSYQAYLNAHIFEPLDMQETNVWKLTDIIPNVAVGYIRPAHEKDEWKTNYHLNKGSSPAGGTYSSTSDLLKFYHGLLSNQLLKQETTQLMFAPKVKTYYGHYGYGIGINKNNDQTIIGHLGGYYGVRGELMWYKESNYIISILANSDQTDYTDISTFIKVELTGTEKEKQAYQNTLDFISTENFATSELNKEAIKDLDKDDFDEALLQIKGYHFFNNKDYKRAKQYFNLNRLLFPESESAMRDFKRVKENSKFP